MWHDKASNKEDEDYFDIFKKCFNLEFPRTNRFGRLNKMCVVCIEKLRQSYEFRKVSDLAYKRLYSHILDWSEDNENFNTQIKIEDSEDVVMNNSTDDIITRDYSDDKYEVLLSNVAEANPEHSNINNETLSGIIKEPNVEYEEERQLDSICESNKDVLIEDNDDFDRFSDCSTNTEEILIATGYYTKKIVPKTIKQIRPEFIKDSLVCQICNKKFMNFYKTYQHFVCHFPKSLCYICGKPLATRDQFLVHWRTHQSVTNEFVCKPCDKVFKSKNILSRHIKVIHNGHKVFKCSHCSEAFKCSTTRVIHMHKVHNISGKVYECDKCNWKFYTGSFLKKHQRRVHSKEFIAFCDVCSRGFVDKKILKDHLWTHADVSSRPCCEVCGHVFSSPRSLRQHMKIHLNIKNYKCSHCDKAFAQKPSLNYHLKRYHITG